jgi:hypothetical protein
MTNECNGNCNQGRSCDCVAFDSFFTLPFLLAVLAVGGVIGFLIGYLVGE